MQSYTAIQNDLNALLDDDRVRAILLDLDTPGGEAAGLTELADWVVDARKEKPIWAIANTSACSGGYWLGASAAKLYAAPMSRVGSIGVVTMHTDVSKAMEKRGVVTTFIYAGKHKVDGNPLGALPDDVRARIQVGVDELYSEFVGAVSTRRGLDEKAVRATEAGVFSPNKALEIGLVDGVGTLGAVLKELNENLSRPHVPGAKMDRTMTELTQADLDRARAEGNAAGLEEGKKLATTEIATALGTLAGDKNPQLTTFVEALNDGVAPGTAVKFAAKIAAPTVQAPAAPAPRSATDAAVDALMAANSPNVRDIDAAPPGDAKAARLAELSVSMKAFNQSRGFSTAA